jgi:LmbE family N-acetylglucosaminyl deacetylase
MVSNRKILVISAHPDDEILGCGGVVALHTDNGDEVTSVIVCEGESHRYEPGEVDQKSATQSAAKILGVSKVITLGLPDQGLDQFTLTDIISKLETVCREVQPHVVYCQHGGDLNRDHQIVFEATLVACRPTEPYIQALYAFDTASSTEWAYPRTFIPDTWVDISSTIDRKLEAMNCYESELRPYPHPRSIESLRFKAHAWGNQAVMDSAEVFMTIRRTVRDGSSAI